MPVRILWIPSYYPSDVRPIAGIFFRRQAQALRAAGHQVDVLVPARGRETWAAWRQHSGLPLFAREADEGGALYRLQHGWTPHLFPGVAAWRHRRAGARAFAQYLAQHGPPDILHGHNVFYGGYMAVYLGKRYTLPVFLTEQSTSYQRGLIRLPGQRRVVRATLGGAARIFAVGPTLATQLERYTIAPIHRLPNVVDVSRFGLMSPPPGAFTFAVVGYLKPLKQVDRLLQAFAQAFPAQDDARLLIAGDGPQRGDLERLAARLGLVARVEFLGAVAPEAMPGVYARCHAVVSASRVETFGVTLIEGMACGRPVVATRSGGPDGYVTTQVGLLIPPEDTPALADALRRMRATAPTYDPAAIRAYAVTQFSGAAFAAAWQAHYDEVIVSAS